MRRTIGALALSLSLLAPAAAHSAGLGSFYSGNYQDAVTVDNILKHEQALQDIADANGGTRAAGTPGNVATIEYIENQMRDAGWKVRRQNFEFPFFDLLSDTVFERVSPDPETYEEGTDFNTMTFSATGDVTAPVTPVDVVVPIDPDSPPSTSNSGCEADDFDGFPEGNIALIQRGSCDFSVKVANAAAAGASAAVIFNEGQPAKEGQDERQGVIFGTLGEPADIPAVDVAYAFGADLVERIRGGETVTLHIKTDTIGEIRSTSNVIADYPGGFTNRTTVVSAHNDSVPAGPGINDDGSGIAMDLELARQLGTPGAGLKPRNHVRFLWVGAEEIDLNGSTYYVEGLSDDQLDRIIAMLDFDMVASPNYVRFVYDGDGSTFGEDLRGPDGSGLIEALFNRSFRRDGLETEPTAFDGRSDYVAFTDAGIPAGGLFTGAEDIKSEEEAAIYGGTAGLAYDPCYHQACDTFGNLNTEVLEQMKNAAADTLYQLTRTRKPIVDGGTVRDPGEALRRRSTRTRSAKRRSASRAASDYRGHSLVK